MGLCGYGLVAKGKETVEAYVNSMGELGLGIGDVGSRRHEGSGGRDLGGDSGGVEFRV